MGPPPPCRCSRDRGGSRLLPGVGLAIGYQTAQERSRSRHGRQRHARSTEKTCVHRAVAALIARHRHLDLRYTTPSWSLDDCGCADCLRKRERLLPEVLDSDSWETAKAYRCGSLALPHSRRMKYAGGGCDDVQGLYCSGSSPRGEEG